MIKTSAIFFADAFHHTWEEGDPILGKDLVEFLHWELSSREAVVVVDQPEECEDHWSFLLKVHGQMHLVDVHWMPIGNEPVRDAWAIHVRQIHSLWKRLLGKKDDLQLLKVACPGKLDPPIMRVSTGRNGQGDFHVRQEACSS